MSESACNSCRSRTAKSAAGAEGRRQRRRRVKRRRRMRRRQARDRETAAAAAAGKQTRVKGKKRNSCLSFDSCCWQPVVQMIFFPRLLLRCSVSLARTHALPGSLALSLSLTREDASRDPARLAPPLSLSLILLLITSSCLDGSPCSREAGERGKKSVRTGTAREAASSAAGGTEKQGKERVKRGDRTQSRSTGDPRRSR